MEFWVTPDLNSTPPSSGFEHEGLILQTSLSTFEGMLSLFVCSSFGKRRQLETSLELEQAHTEEAWSLNKGAELRVTEVNEKV